MTRFKVGDRIRKNNPSNKDYRHLQETLTVCRADECSGTFSHCNTCKSIYDFAEHSDRPGWCFIEKHFHLVDSNASFEL